MPTPLTSEGLKRDAARYKGTPGISQNAATIGFLPAFRDEETGETHLSTFADGSLATIHLLEGLPDGWVLERDRAGRVLAIKDSVVPGFVRDGRFLTREELASGGFDS
jgi:hypothetical protein